MFRQLSFDLLLCLLKPFPPFFLPLSVPFPFTQLWLKNWKGPFLRELPLCSALSIHFMREGIVTSRIDVGTGEMRSSFLHWATIALDVYRSVNFHRNREIHVDHRGGFSPDFFFHFFLSPNSGPLSRIFGSICIRSRLPFQSLPDYKKRILVGAAHGEAISAKVFPVPSLSRARVNSAKLPYFPVCQKTCFSRLAN